MVGVDAANLQRTGKPNEAAFVWLLTKGRKQARCSLWTHPIGAELRVEAAGEFVRSQAGRDVLALVELAGEWREQFVTKGWAA